MYKKVVQHSLFALVNLLLVFSCDNGNNAYDENIDGYEEEFIEKTYSKEYLLEFKKNEIVAFYDKIGFEIIDLVLKDRVYETKPESRTKLKGISLDSIPGKLNKKDEENVKKYAEELIKYKNTIIISHNDEVIVRNFKKDKDSLLKSTFFKDTIIGLNIKGLARKDEPEYISLINTINNLADEVNTRLLEINNQPTIEAHTNEVIDKEKKDIDNKKNETKDYSFLWLGLLVMSVLINILQFVFFRKKIKKIVTYASNNEAEYLNENIKEYKRSSQENFATSILTKLKSTRVKEIIDEVYDQMLQFLSDKYHQDCVILISNQFNSFRSKAFDILNSKSFNNQLEVEKKIKPIIDEHQSILENEIDKCISKSNAESNIENAVKREKFDDVANIELLSEDEINAIIEQMKQAIFLDLSATINRHQLVSNLDELEENIIEALQKKIKDSLVRYFPFTDANGSLDDEKKTKEIERDSAIKLSINNEDMSKATFTLLYEEDDMMHAGIMSYDSFLIPICELKSEDFNSTGTRIEQIGNDGTMELEDGYWKVKDKLPIKVI